MAEVLVSTQTISNIMLHSPPDAYHAASGQVHHTSSRGQQVPRGYGSHNGGVAYRGASSTPVAPYAFQSTPHLRQENRTVSAPSYRQSSGPAALSSNRQSYAPSSSNSTASSTTASNASSAGGHYSVSKDDSVLVDQRQSSQFGPRGSNFLTSSSTPDLSLTNFDSTPKPSPDRYRRVQRRTESSSSVNAPQQTLSNQKYSPPSPAEPPSPQSNVSGSKGSRVSTGPSPKGVSVDDSQTTRQLRYKRRSVVEPVVAPTPIPVNTAGPTWSQVVARGHSGPVNPVISAPSNRPISHHQRNNSSNSTSSTGSGNVKRPATVSLLFLNTPLGKT
jgi:hypothetical protein